MCRAAPVAVRLLLVLAASARASEFPERECCDLEYPSSTANPTPTSAGTPGPNTKTAVAILNCLLARQLCLEDVSCAAILEIIPRVCGPELVACSTVTVTKCQAALRTLQAFPFFKPTCLCREPHVDPECNSFRDFLFDHPCAFVLIKERDPYPVDSLPTCNHALSVCQQERKCMKLYEDFKLSCKVRDNRCRMDDRDLCHESWTNLRRSPMFGCICPNNHMKKRCDRIFNVVNHNPCVASENASASFDYGLGNSIVENPLVDAANGLDAHADYDHISVSVLKNIGKNVTHYPEDLDSILVTAQHQKNPSGSSEPSSAGGDASRLVFRSTCHLAMENCNSNYRCRMSLAPILHHCDISRCNRNSCMEALQSFYRKPEITWNVDIAFCLCKKTDDKQDTCLIAQEKLHPICAQKIEGSAQPTCLNLAEVCRESKECRTRLEHYEQSCAVDSVTKKCAGSPEECRKAMLGILGTDLRTSCVCKGTDMSQLYECLGWQRLLWVNPCVVESQKAFHAKLALEEAMKTTTTTTTTSRPRYHLPPVQLTMMTATEASLQTRNEERLPAPPPLVLTTVASTTMLTTTRMTTTTTTSTTTTTTEATTISPRYCVVQRPLFPDQYIKEGTLKRIYHEDECSDVCECENGEKLTCKTLCIDRMPCKTEFADYSHAAPAYQAYRGRCLCYSGKFICMKPPMGDYSLPQGVFLFLGYSQVDERELNKNQTRIIVHDVVKTLQEVVQREAVNGTLCSLELFNSTKENVIIMARLDSRAVDYAMLSPTESLAKEKEECIEYLDVITEKINNRHPDFASHLLLSIFKMAEVEIVQVEASSSSWRLDESKVLMVGALILSVFRMKLIS